MADRNQLEPLDDGWVAFRTENGARWKHKDMTAGRVGEGYRVFIADTGEERRYHFAADELHDATIEDLRDQLKRSEPAPPGRGTPAAGTTS